MKKVGREVLLLEAKDGIARIGEGSFIKLNNGTILFGFTCFTAGNEDEDCAEICFITSSDKGETWSQKQVLFTKSCDAINIMSLSFLRLNSGDIGAFYIEKNSDGTDKILFTVSNDEAKSWSTPINCIDGICAPDYYVINNDRPLKLKSGRILLPIARHTIYTKADFAPGEICFVYSDDEGKTWSKTGTELKCPFPNDPNGFQEPGLYETENGKILCYIRTGLGFQFQCFSEDSGETWSQPEPNTFFSSPCSPMSIKDAGDLTVAIFNPVPEHVLREDEEEFWGRTPYTIAISTDKGKTFTREKLYFLEDDLNNGYCYPAVFDGGDYMLIAYYHSNNTPCCLNSTKITKIAYSEFKQKN